MKKPTLRSFRKTLRTFERLNQLLNTRCCTEITLAQCHVLLEIEEYTEATTILLADNLKLDKSTLSRTIDRLVDTGMVERRSHPSDRRFTLLVLSEKGKKTCDEINRISDDIHKQVFQEITSVRHEQIIDHMEIYVRAMAEYYRKRDNDLLH